MGWWLIYILMLAYESVLYMYKDTTCKILFKIQHKQWNLIYDVMHELSVKLYHNLHHRIIQFYPGTNILWTILIFILF